MDNLAAIALIELTCGCKYGVFDPAPIPKVGEVLMCTEHPTRVWNVKDVIQAAPLGGFGVDRRASSFVEGVPARRHPSMGNL